MAETLPRWQVWGHPEEVNPINVYVRCNGDVGAAHCPGAPEHPGPSLAEASLDGFKVVEKPPRHHE